MADHSWRTSKAQKGLNNAVSSARRRNMAAKVVPVMSSRKAKANLRAAKAARRQAR